MYKIAICGKANSGKNTLAKMLVKHLRLKIRDNNGPYTASRAYIAFADPIKRMIQEMFPEINSKYLFGSSKFRNEIIPGAFKGGKPLTIRQLLIDLGTEVGRAYKQDVWLDNFDYQFKKAAHCKIVVVTDVRFRNEFDHLKDKGFHLIKLYRGNDTPSINHISETGQNDIKDDEFDFVIHNDKSLNELKKLVVDGIIPNLKDN